MRKNKALRTTKSSLFTEFFHERSWKKRGGLRNLFCFLAVLMIAGAASAQELPAKIETQWFMKGATVSLNQVTNIHLVEGGQFQTNIGYQYDCPTFQLANGVNALALGVYVDDGSGEFRTNALLNGTIMADGCALNSVGNNRMAVYYWYNPPTETDLVLTVQNTARALDQGVPSTGFCALGLSGIDTSMEPNLTPVVDESKDNNTILIETNNMYVVSYASHNSGYNLEPPVTDPPWEWIDSVVVVRGSGGGGIVAAAQWFARGDVTSEIQWTGFNNSYYGVHAIAFPTTRSKNQDPWYLPEIRIENVTPANGSTVTKNPVQFSANVITFGTEFEKAEFTINGEVVRTEYVVTGEEEYGGTTNKVTSFYEYEYGASSNLLFDLEIWTSQHDDKYFYSFKMGDEFAYAMSPANNAVVADLTPTIEASVYDGINEAKQIHLYVDGIPMAVDPVYDGGTSTVTYTTEKFEPGKTVNYEVRVEDTFGDVFTNKASFSLTGIPNRATVWNADNIPQVKPGLDQYYFGYATGAIDNIGNNEIDITNHHEWTFVSGSDRPSQGQTFTVPEAVGGVAGFDLDSVWIKQSAYYETRDDDESNAMWFNFSADKSLILRITDPAKADTDDFVIAEYDLRIANTMTNFSGNWIQLRLPEPIVLDANKQYGFDVATASADPHNPIFNMDGLAGSSRIPADYPGGTAYSSGDRVGENYFHTNAFSMNYPTGEGAGDRAFIVPLTPTTRFFSVGAVTPRGTGVLNPLRVEIPLTEVIGSFYPTLSKIEIDGVGELETDYDVDPEDDTRVTFWGTFPDDQQLKPMNTYTGLYVLANHPGQGGGGITNTFTFTMGEAYAFADKLPATTVIEETVDVSVNVINKADTFGSARLLLDDVDLSVTTSPTVGSTTTVSATTGELTMGPHTMKVIVTSANAGFDAVTNTWNFNVRTRVKDRMWNVNIAGSGAQARNVADGTVAIAPPAGSNLWNNLTGSTDPRNVHTNNFIDNVYDANGENPISILTYGTYDWNNNYTGAGEIRVDLFKGWVGGSYGGQGYNHDSEWSITGLNASAAYDLYILSTWTWNENDARFDITEGYPLDGNNSKSLTPERDNVSVSANRAKSADDFSACVEGQNYIIFERVTPTPDGVISFHAGFGVDCIISALQIHEHKNEAFIPYATLVTTEPRGNVFTNPLMKVVILDVGDSIVKSNLVTMRLDGNVIDPNDPMYKYERDGITSTVTYVTTGLKGLATNHTASIFVESDSLISPDSVSNSWEFFMGGMRAVEPELAHHWAMDETTGKDLIDSVGGKHGRIVGRKYQRVTEGDDGGVKLVGGGTNGQWNDGEEAGDAAGAGAYIDLPNGIISELDSEAVTIEIRFESSMKTAWARILDFGTSYDGDGIASSWVTPNTNNCFVLVANSDTGYGQMSLRLKDAPTTVESVSIKKLADGQVNHIVTAVDTVGRAFYVYRNGQRVNNEVVEYALPVSFAPLSEFVDNNNWIARSQWEHDPLFEGTVYDVRIYKGIVTREQALAHYEGNYDDTPPPPPPASPDVSLTVPAGGPLTISWLSTGGNNNFNVMTNADLTNPEGWGVVEGTMPVEDGGYWNISIEFGEESSLFYKLRANQ